MKKSDVKNIQNRALYYMNNEDKIIAGKLKVPKIPSFYYAIFEDANFHELNKYLVNKGIFDDTNIDYESYKEYRKLGGRTWNI